MMRKSKKQRILIWLSVILALLCLGVWFFWLRTEQAAAPSGSKTPGTPIKNTGSVHKPVEFDKTQFSLDDPASPWVVVNKRRPLQPTAYVPNNLVSVGGGVQLRREAAESLSRMLAAAAEAGHTVTAASGYRSYDRQTVVYANEVKAYGQTVADTQSARPGTSEHQTGWAVDLSSGGCRITNCFGGTPGGQWVTAHAAEYGFILRYPSGKQSVTGYRTEVWHFRYIGTLLAKELKETHSLTLEEFFGLPAAPDYAGN